MFVCPSGDEETITFDSDSGNNDFSITKNPDSTNEDASPSLEGSEEAPVTLTDADEIVIESTNPNEPANEFRVMEFEANVSPTDPTKPVEVTVVFTLSNGDTVPFTVSTFKLI